MSWYLFMTGISSIAIPQFIELDLESKTLNKASFFYLPLSLFSVFLSFTTLCSAMSYFHFDLQFAASLRNGSWRSSSIPGRSLGFTCRHRYTKLWQAADNLEGRSTMILLGSEGMLPVASSYAMTPSDHMSTSIPQSLPQAISGAGHDKSTSF